LHWQQQITLEASDTYSNNSYNKRKQLQIEEAETLVTPVSISSSSSSRLHWQQQIALEAADTNSNSSYKQEAEAVANSSSRNASNTS
jgi:hypothetical protein